MTSCIPWFRIFFLLSVVCIFEIENSPVRADDFGALEQKVYDLVNEHRAAIGLEPLNYSEDIAIVARRHSRDMVRGNVGMGHEGVEERGRTLAKVITYSQFGENVGTNSQEPSSTSRTAVAAWLNSSGHRANIEGKFDLTGVGIVRSGNTFFFTQIFLTTRASSHTPVNTHRSRDRLSEQNYTPEHEQDKSPPRTQGAYDPSRKSEEEDPRKRLGRKRVHGGWVQDLDADR